jgi:hypothetical protein
MAEANSHDGAIGDVSGIAIRLLDDIYDAWSRAQFECHNALRAWLDSGSRPGFGSRNHAAYCVYRAALDREEAAAIDLERVSHLVRASRLVPERAR